MTTKITVNRTVKIKVNGVEYDSIDQLPPEVRAAYEKAIKSSSAQVTTVTFNDKPGSVDELPPDVRAVLSNALAPAATRKPTPLWVWAIVVATLAALVTFLLQRAR